MNTLINYTDKAIMKLLLSHVQQLNPWIKIGGKVTCLTPHVRNGIEVTYEKEDPMPANFIKTKHVPSNVTLPKFEESKYIEVQTAKLNLNDIESFNIAGLARLDFKLTKPTYIHPYSIEIGAREWLEKYTLGDLVSIAITEPVTFRTVYVETPLTQEMIDENSSVFFRFALSDV